MRAQPFLLAAGIGKDGNAISDGQGTGTVQGAAYRRAAKRTQRVIVVGPAAAIRNRSGYY